MPPEQVLGKITSQPFHKIRLARTIKHIPKFNCISLSGLIPSFFFEQTDAVACLAGAQNSGTESSGEEK